MSKTTKAARRSSAEWASLIEAFARSGLSRSAFAEREGIHLGTFAWWASRLGNGSTPGREPKAARVAMPDATSFVPVRVRTSGSAGPRAATTHEHARVVQAPASKGVEVLLGNGRVVRCELAHVDDPRLAALLTLVEGARAC